MDSSLFAKNKILKEVVMKKITIVGGGILGTQIGLVCAYWGKDVTLWLRSEASIERTSPKIERYSSLMMADLDNAKTLIGNPMGQLLYPRGLIKEWNSVTEKMIDELYTRGKDNLKNIHIELDLEKALSDAEIIIETISEDPSAKKELYSSMRPYIGSKALLLTNSSTMLPSQFAEYTGCPARYLAMHFANSIWKNNMVEIMGHPGTSENAYNLTVEFAEQISMTPICLNKEQPGYVLNSMLIPFLSSAQALWANDIADPETIDKAWEIGTGAPMGPFKILDVVGLETVYNINLMKPGANDDGNVFYKICKKLKGKIDNGETGINAGKGFYQY